MSLYRSFDHYDPPIGSDRTPYAYFEALRDEAVSTNAPIGWSEGYGGFWVVTGWEQAREILLNPTTFSSKEVTFPPFGTPGGRPIMLSGYDEPAHTRYRRILQAPFSPVKAQEMTDYFREDVNVLIDRFIDSGRVDVAEALAQTVPGRMAAMLLGRPAEDGDLYRTWVHSIAMQVHKDPEGAARHMKAMDDHFNELLAERRAHPGDDVLSSVVNWTNEGDRLTDEEIYDFFVVLLIGTIDNTLYLLANMLWRLAWDIDLRRQLLRQPDLLEPAIDEFLRFYSPNMSARLITERVEIGGVVMTPGQHVVVFHPIINRDPAQFDNPDAFIPDRTPNRHLALGLGIHRCLGVHLVRVEATVVAQEFMRRIPEWHLDPVQPSTWNPGQTGGMGSVPIVFPPGGGYPDKDWTPVLQATASQQES